jgi:hypothetical protein
MRKKAKLETTEVRGEQDKKKVNIICLKIKKTYFSGH